MTLGSTYHFIYFYQRCIHFGTSASLRKLCGRKDYSCSFRRLAYAPNLMHELIRLVCRIFPFHYFSSSIAYSVGIPLFQHSIIPFIPELKNMKEISESMVYLLPLPLKLSTMFSIRTVALIAEVVWSGSSPRVLKDLPSSSQVIRVSTRASVLPPGGMVTR